MMEAVLSVEGIATRYSNGALGIEDVTLEVRRHQVVVLLGPNGAGKTTTVRSISGFLRSERASVVRGRVLLDGQDVTGLEPHRTARLGVGLVPERTKVFANLTVLENLRAVRRRGRRSDEGLERAFDLFPALAERRRQAAGSLSGGQQQMLAISRALLMEPRVLLIDELTLGLHQSFFEPIFGALRGIARSGTGVLVIDESVAASLDVADHCYLLGGGQVRLSGPASELAGHELLAAGYVEG